LARAEKLNAKSNRIYNNAANKIQKLEALKHESALLLNDVQKNLGSVHETIISLNNYGSHDDHIKLPAALKEAQKYMQEMKKQSKSIPNTDDITKCAIDQSDFWIDENEKATRMAEKLHEFELEKASFNNKLESLKNHTRKSFRDSSETEAFISKHKKALESLKSKFEVIDSLYRNLSDLLDGKIIAQSDVLMEQLHDNIAQLKVEERDLEELSVQVDGFISENEKNLDDVMTEWIPKAKDHANQLSHRSKTIVDLFRNSRDGAQIALRAGTAHKNISESIKLAQESARKAYELAVQSNEELNPVGEDTILEKGLDSLHESNDIQKDALTEISKIEGDLHN